MFGKLVNGGEVLVHLKDGEHGKELAFELTPAPPKAVGKKAAAKKGKAGGDAKPKSEPAAE